MKIFIDSSVFVEAIKNNSAAIELLEKILSLDANQYINLNVIEESLYVLKKAGYETNEILEIFDEFELLALDEKTYEKFKLLLSNNKNIKTINDLLHYAYCEANDIEAIATLDKNYLKIKSTSNIKIITSSKEIK